MNWRQQILRYLWRARIRDHLKYPPEIAGWRDTRDVAEAFGWSMATARRRLTALFEREDIECCGPSPYSWFVQPRAGNDDDGEPLPVEKAA